VNRGQQSTEVIVLLFALLVRFPDRIIMLRGNHESATITKVYGFYDECKRRHSIKLWNQFVNAFNCMPLVALIDDKIMCMHGGISPSMESFKDVENFDRPLDIPSEGLITDLMWNDPDEEATDWTENERGCGQVFGPR
jgi:serine/threonine-protein phosphatase PP1 catalytic subunit